MSTADHGLVRLNPPSTRSVALVGVLLVGFGGSVALRTTIGGAGVTRSALAGLIFAAVLIVLTCAAGVGPRRRTAGPPSVQLAAGLAGAAVLCVPALLSRLASDSLLNTTRGNDRFVSWAFVVAIVAVAEEAFLRGALYAALRPAGRLVAISVTAIAFAALHVPLYGWGALPLDLAVGIWLGALRAVTGSFLAPAVAHTAADLAAWWLV